MTGLVHITYCLPELFALSKTLYPFYWIRSWDKLDMSTRYLHFAVTNPPQFEALREIRLGREELTPFCQVLFQVLSILVSPIDWKWSSFCKAWQERLSVWRMERVLTTQDCQVHASKYPHVWSLKSPCYRRGRSSWAWYTWPTSLAVSECSLNSAS